MAGPTMRYLSDLQDQGTLSSFGMRLSAAVGAATVPEKSSTTPVDVRVGWLLAGIWKTASDRRRRRALALVIVGISLGLPLASAKASDAGSSDHKASFFGVTPSLAVGLGFFTTDVDGSVIAACTATGAGDPSACVGNAWPEPTVRPPRTGGVSALTPMAQISIGLESPSLDFLPGRPSLFAQGDYFATFSLERNTASEGGAQGFEPPFARPGEGFFEEGIAGQGSKAIVSTKTSAFGASGGLSFPIEIGGFSLRIKPGVSWMFYTWELEGRVLRALCESDFCPGGNFRGIELLAEDSFDSHGVGPYLGIELETAAFGPLLASTYIEAAGYRILSSQNKMLRSGKSYDDFLGTETYDATWGFEFDDWAYRATVGVRLYLKQD